MGTPCYGSGGNCASYIWEGVGVGMTIGLSVNDTTLTKDGYVYYPGKKGTNTTNSYEICRKPA